MIECSFSSSVVLGFSPVAVSYTSYFLSVSNKEFFKIQATIECGFTPKCVRDMTRTYSKVHFRDKSSQHSLIIWSIG